MKTETIEITTPDGTAAAYDVTPDGEGPHPAILFCMDGLGMRDALKRMADRLGAAGYHVLMGDHYHRVGREVHFDPKVVFASPDGFMQVRKVVGALDAAMMMRDARAFVDALAARPGVDASLSFGIGAAALTGFVTQGGSELNWESMFGPHVEGRIGYRFSNGLGLATTASYAYLTNDLATYEPLVLAVRLTYFTGRRDE